MMFWFNKYLKQRNDYNAIVRPIFIRGFPLPDSHSPALHSIALASQLTLCTPFASVLSGFSTNSAFSISLSFPALSRTCPENARGQGHAGLFHENYSLKKKTDDTLMYRRCRGSCNFVYGSADTLGLLAPILHEYAYFCIKNYILAEYLI